MKKQNKILIIIIFLVVFLIIEFFIRNRNFTNEVEDDSVEIINNITGTNVVASSDLSIFMKKNERYVKVGTIYKDNYIKLVSNKVIDGKYVLVDGFDSEYYIAIDNIENIDEIDNVDYRYKKYIVFNENIVTKDIFNFYDDSGNKIYSLDFSVNLPIIIKDDGRYGVEFNNRLLYVNEDDVREIVVSDNTDVDNTDGIRVLNYHFFYDDSVRDGCYEEICASKTQLETHLNYFRDNEILTLKMDEVEMYIDGKINLPRSVLITIDDGWRTKVAVDLLGQYEMYATIFLVTSWFDVDSYYKNSYIELHSHGDNLHNQGICEGGQGGAIKCLDEESLINDLKTSSKKLNDSKVFAYPFYEYNDYSISVLEKAGFKMAFVGESSTSDNLVHVGSNKYKLPRFVVVDYTTMDDIKKYFGDIG